MIAPPRVGPFPCRLYWVSLKCRLNAGSTRAEISQWADPAQDQIRSSHPIEELWVPPCCTLLNAGADGRNSDLVIDTGKDRPTRRMFDNERGGRSRDTAKEEPVSVLRPLP